MKNKELREMARARACFKVHLSIYLVIIGFLAFINFFTSSGHLWFLWPAAGWGIAIVIHGFTTYLGTGKSFEEREYQKLKKRRKIRF